MKGFWRLMESVIAVILVMVFLASAGSVYVAKPPETGMTVRGHEMLRELDVRDELRPLAASRDYSAIDSMIDLPGYDHAVQICDFAGSCNGTYPEARNVMVSSYIISGYDEYEPLEIKLYIW